MFLLIGVSFLASGWVHSQRGHVGIEAVAAILPARVNAWRLLFVDLLSGVFCAFFAWKSWTLFDEAYVGGYYSDTAWAPPLWIPYSLMAVGMSLLSLQIFLQAFQLKPARP